MLEQVDVERLEVEAVNSAQARQPLYAARKKIFPKRAVGQFPPLQMAGDGWSRSASTTSRPGCAGTAGRTRPTRPCWSISPTAASTSSSSRSGRRNSIFVAGLLIMAGIGLFLVTSTVGRAWCGYTCPQTVWTDLFLVVERCDRGRPQRPHQARRRRRGPLDKLVQARRQARDLAADRRRHRRRLDLLFRRRADAACRCRSPARRAPVAYITVAILTATTYIFGGLMREQVCTYMCPWPRIQAAMLDENSLTVTYNDWRGEPRSRHAKKAAAAGRAVGDCVDCNACVAVCPMGIDIRDGQQLECITCALCIDACDGVMDKIGKERGLISYATLSDYNANMALATAAARGAIEPARVRDADRRLVRQGRRISTCARSSGRAPSSISAAWSLVGLALLYGAAQPRPARRSTCCTTAIRNSSRCPTARSATATRSSCST